MAALILAFVAKDDTQDGWVSDRIRHFIGTELLSREDGSSLQEGTKLLGGLIDSVGMMQLVLFLQEDFHVSITPAEAGPDQFRTVGDVESLVRGKLRP